MSAVDEARAALGRLCHAVVRPGEWTFPLEDERAKIEGALSAVAEGGGNALALSDDELWKVYDLVTARTEALEACEIAACGPLGGEPWRLLRRKIRAKLPVPEVPR